MLSHWVIGLLALSGFAYVSGDYCDPATANVCYEDLLHYETLAFPLYGEDKAKLEDTCANINGSYECLHQFLSYCSEETAECDEDCQDLKKLAKHFTRYSGLENLYEDLCTPESVLSKTYLENVECLYSIADSYASCHNDSQASQHYLSTQPQNIETRCCFFKWHDECFKNATSERCGENATFFVSFATHKLIGRIAEQICVGVESTCTRPPLPPPGEGDIEHEDTTEMTTEMTTESDSDNEIDDTSAAMRAHATNWILLPFLYILLSKYAL